MDVSLYFLVAFIDKLIFVQWEGLYLSGGSVTYSDIYVVRMENEIGAPFNPKFYRRYRSYIFNQRKKMLKIFFSPGSTVTIKTSNLPLNLVQLNFLTQD